MFLADGGTRVGGGHLSRCLALGNQMRQCGWNVWLALSPAARDVMPVGWTEADAEYIALPVSGEPGSEVEAMQDALPDGCDLLVIDHYGRDKAFESACRPWAKRVLAIDDIPNRHHDCDLLLDQTYGRIDEEYAGLIPDGTQCLCGSAYALLRDDFAGIRLGQRTLRADSPRRRLRLLISMGATDNDDATSLVLAGVQMAGLDLEVDAVLGRGAPHIEKVRQAAAALKHPARVHTGLSEMAALMATADIAIGAAGVTAWERCCIGLPTVMVALYANQRDVALALSAAGAVVAIDQAGFSASTIETALATLVADPEGRAEMARRAQLITDGLGARRVALIVDPCRDGTGQAITLRPAILEDAMLLLEWQRHPDTRRYFRNPEMPDESEHLVWMRTKLEDPSCIFNIVLQEGTPVGMLRLDRKIAGPDDKAVFEVSVLVSPASKRQGIGHAALAAGRRLVPEADLLAEVLPENAASVALFESAGYRRRTDGRFCLEARPYAHRNETRRRLER